MTEPFALPVRVYYEDTDAAGVLHHAACINFFERARSEWLRALGFEQKRLRDERGLLFAVRKLSAQYDAPAHLDDVLRVSAEIKRMGGASVLFAQRAWRDDTVIAQAEVLAVCVRQASTPSGRFCAAPLPPDIRLAMGGKAGK